MLLHAYGDNDTEDGIMLENEVGHLLEEPGVGMPADLTLELDQTQVLQYPSINTI